MKLATKSVLAWLLSVVLPLAALAGLAVQSVRTGVGEQVHATLRMAAARELDAVVDQLGLLYADVRDWSHLSVMQDVSGGDANGDVRAALNRLLGDESMLRSVVAIAADGSTVARAGTPAALDAPVSAEVADAVLSGRAVRGQLRQRADGVTTVPVAVPVYASAAPDVLIGALIAEFDWQVVGNRLRGIPVLGGQQDSEHAVVLSTTRDGALLYATAGLPDDATQSGAPETRGESGEFAWRGTTWVVASAATSSRVTGESGENGYGRASALLSHMPQADDLRIHIMVSAGSAYASVRDLRDSMLVSLAPLLGLASLVALFALRSLVRPILSLSRASDRLAANDFDYALPPAGGDEVGRLTASFARMRDAVARHRDDLLAQIEERRRTERELTEAHRRALEAGQAKMRFLAAMSHEIRTPINGVLGMTDLLLKGELKPQQRRFAENIERSGVVLLGVVNDILDLSRIESGRFQLDDAPFDLRAVLEDAVDMLAESADRKGLELGCVVPAELPTAVRGDVLRLRQVLTNLLGNAVKFTATGEVSLRVECQGERDGRLLMRFEVRDTGIGIEKEALSRIFDSFSQADSSTTRRFGGTGLGLAISRHLVDLMGGEMGVDSSPGEGSTFWFSTALEPAAATVKEDARSLAGLRVLVVDDNATNREILSHQLTDLGAEHATAAGGEEALEALRQAHRRGDSFQAMVVDQQMPGMNGLQLARAVRAEDEFADLPLVLLSSICADDGDDWREVGVESRLTKPIRRAELYLCLAGACRQMASEGPHAPTQTQAARRALAGRRVLLAEDHPVNREVQMAMLDLLGCEASIAEDGEQALAALEHEHFDLVLMDCDMPVMDGFEATAALRRREHERGAPRQVVVALTANSLEGDRERCLQAGMDDYLTKPVVTDTLREALLRWMPSTPMGRDDEALGSVSARRTAEGPVLDPRVIEGIRASNRERAASLLHELAERYTSSFERDTDALREAAVRGDTETVRRLARRLKSSGATLGARGLEARCQAIEVAAVAGEIEARDAAIDELYREYQRVQHALDDECRRVA